MTRQDVFTIAANQIATETYVAGAVWGAGPRARAVERCLRVFAGTPPGTIAHNLQGAFQLLQGAGPVAAYDALHGAGNLSIKFLGPSFGTKFLYFAGFDPAGAGLQPLILDKNVAVALNRLCHLGWPIEGGWATSQYRQYLELAHDWARRWNTDADVVERVLLDIGRASPLSVSALSGR